MFIYALDQYRQNEQRARERETRLADQLRQEQAKLDPARLSAAGYAEFRPRGPNDTEAGRKANRRIEILLVPMPAAGQEAAATPSQVSAAHP